MVQHQEREFLGHCPVCHIQIPHSACALVRKRRNVSTLYAECRSCRTSQILMLVPTRGGDMATIGMLTDLTVQDMRAFARQKPISDGEIAGARKWFGNKAKAKMQKSK